MAITTTARGVSNGVNNKRYTYVSDTSVVTGVPAEVEIVPDKDYGTITEFTFESSSPDCDVFISEVSGAAKTDAETRVQVDNIDIGFSNSMKANPASYSTGATGTKKLFVNVVNNSLIETDPWTLVIRYDQ
jgi:hypothetical protein